MGGDRLRRHLELCLRPLYAGGRPRRDVSDDGLATTDFAGDDAASDVPLQPDGKLVAVGYAGGLSYDFGLARLDADGSLDPTFAGDGTQTTHFDANDGAAAVALQPDGKLVVAGFAGRGVGTRSSPSPGTDPTECLTQPSARTAGR